MTNPNPVPPMNIEERVQAIMLATGKDEQTVRQILSALEVDPGDEVGTIKFNSGTGELAHRVLDKGIVKWRISHPTEGVHYDLAPTLPDWMAL